MDDGRVRERGRQSRGGVNLCGRSVGGHGLTRHRHMTCAGVARGSRQRMPPSTAPAARRTPWQRVGYGRERAASVQPTSASKAAHHQHGAIATCGGRRAAGDAQFALAAPRQCASPAAMQARAPRLVKIVRGHTHQKGSNQTTGKQR
jgi:hypothetical protein